MATKKAAVMEQEQHEVKQERAVVRMREYGTMKLEQAQKAVTYLNERDLHMDFHYEWKNRYADRWIIIRVLPVCNMACVAAAGDECNCHCSGKHHGQEVA